MKETFTTKDAAQLIGIHLVTLHRWMALGLARPSEHVCFGSRTYYRWTKADINHARQIADVRRKAGHWPNTRRQK